MEKEKKPIYKKWWFWLIIVIVVVAIGGSGNNNTETVNKISQTSSDSTVENISAENQTSDSENTSAKVGEEITTKNLKIAFTSLSDYTDYSQYSKPKEGNKVIRAEIGFENISSSDVSLNNIECYADGEKCEAFYSAEDYKSPTLESISSGKKFKSIIYYEVPENAESIILEYETDLWSSKKVEFIVK